MVRCLINVQFLPFLLLANVFEYPGADSIDSLQNLKITMFSMRERERYLRKMTDGANRVVNRSCLQVFSARNVSDSRMQVNTQDQT